MQTDAVVYRFKTSSIPNRLLISLDELLINEIYF
jgi:hypothetical protein